MLQLIPLTQVRSGCRASIEELSGTHADIQRMEELGLRRGHEIEVIQGGCPCIVRCRGAKYCLRGNDCTCVWVQVEVD